MKRLLRDLIRLYGSAGQARPTVSSGEG
jgi:hypothetical protein